MHMAGGAVNQEGFAAEVSNNVSHVGEQFVPPVLLEGSPTLLGREMICRRICAKV
jgi:hypothetical protein